MNEFKDGIQALSAVVEAYWMPFTFAMNWKFTRPHAKVTLVEGEPFCFFFPIAHGLLAQCEPTLRHMRDEPALQKQYKIGVGQRCVLEVAKTRKGKGFKVEECKHLMWPSWYMRGVYPDGTDGSDHQKSVALKPFTPAAES